MAKPPKKTSLKKLASRRPWIRWVLIGVPALFVGAMVLLGVAYATAPLPKTSDVATAHSTIVYDRAGRVLARFHAEVDRVDVPLAQVPKVMQEAVLAAEDRNFYKHGGVSLPDLVRAAFANVVSRKVVQGGSTITQQYVKNAYVGNSRTMWRKFREVIVATKLERTYSKDQILERYLNTVYFGRGAYGVEAAARTFFGVSATKLNVEQSAYLAGAIRSPERLSHDLDLGEKRRNRILRRMLDLKMIDDKAASKALATKLVVLPRRGNAFSAVAGAHFVEEVRKDLIARFGSDEVYRGGLRVTTTLDLKWQRYAEAAVHDVLDRKDDPEAALVAVDPHTGAVRALVGGRFPFRVRQIDLATQAHRQPGSSFKPFVLAAAIDDGLSVRTKFRAPASITLETGYEPWHVNNYDGRDYGTLDLVQATENSVNTVYAQLITKIGASKVVVAAHAAGITSKLSAVPSLALGTSVVTPLEMAGAYSTFANGGMSNHTYYVTKVVDGKGKLLFERKNEPVRGLSNGTANTVAYTMQQVIENGTGRRADIGRPAAGKTGTTEEHADAWFGGYTPDLTAVVWMGYPEGERPMRNVHGTQAVGGMFPAQMWKQFMEKALEGIPPKDFGKPNFAGETPTPSPASPSPSPSAIPSASLPPSATIVPSPTPKSTAKGKPSPSSSPSPSPSASPSPAST